jgi:transcriptional regulator with XRE-family HTH domain
MNTAVQTDLGNKEIFSRNLRRYVESSQKTQKEVAKAIGVSTGTFNDWMKGRSYPRMDKVQLLAEYFGIQKSDLVEDVNFSKSEISDKEQELLDLFHKVPDEKKDHLLNVIQAVINTL